MNTEHDLKLASFNLSKLAQEKGFDWKCSQSYTSENDVWHHDFDYNSEDLKRYHYKYMFYENVMVPIPAPKLTFLKRWLREVKNMDIMVFPTYKLGTKIKRYTWLIFDNPEFDDYMSEEFGTYEEALEQAIKECLKLL